MTRLPKAVAAEVRFVEEGHHTFAKLAGSYEVVSDSRPGITYEVTIVSWLDLLRGLCNCPAGNHSRHGTAVPCKHTAGVFRRLEREGLARFDGRVWRDTHYTPRPPLSTDELSELLEGLS